MSTLQVLVDSLGDRIKRAVAIDDTRFRLQAYSPHFGPIDSTRLESILRREASAETVVYVLSYGIAKAEGPVRVPAHEEAGLLPRVCVPIRCQTILLGYVFLIDPDESLDDDAIQLAVEVAESAGVILYREQLLNELDRSKQRELLRDLLSEEETVRQQAATGLVTGEFFLAKGPVLVIVVNVSSSRGEVPDDGLHVTIARALERASRLFGARQCLHLARVDHGILVASSKEAALRRNTLTDVAEQLRAEIAAQLDDSWRVVVGVGEPCPELVSAKHSYVQATQAVRVGQCVPHLGLVVRWSQLGIYTVLARVPPAELTADVLHPGLVRLLEQARSENLLETLECYLDHAGDAKATAAALLLHRTSLYYRLHKVEELAGVSLDDGNDRLAMHLGLKMSRLAGLYPVSGA